MTQFATTSDVAARLGRELTTAETAQADAALTMATALIAEAIGRDDTWSAALSPIPTIISGIAVEAVVRLIANPLGVRSQSETLGAYAHSESYTDSAAGAGIYLTDIEARLCSRAIWGTTTVSTRANTLADHLARSVLDDQLIVLTDADPDTETV